MTDDGASGASSADVIAWFTSVVIVCDNNSTRTIGQSSKFCELAKICGLGSFAVNAQFPFEVFSVVHSAAIAAALVSRPIDT